MPKKRKRRHTTTVRRTEALVIGDVVIRPRRRTVLAVDLPCGAEIKLLSAEQLAALKGALNNE